MAAVTAPPPGVSAQHRKLLHCRQCSWSDALVLARWRMGFGLMVVVLLAALILLVPILLPAAMAAEAVTLRRLAPAGRRSGWPRFGAPDLRRARFVLTSGLTWWVSVPGACKHGRDPNVTPSHAARAAAPDCADKWRSACGGCAHDKQRVSDVVQGCHRSQVAPSFHRSCYLRISVPAWDTLESRPVRGGRS